MNFETVGNAEATAWKDFSFYRVGSKPYGVGVSLTGTTDPLATHEVSTYIEQLIRKYGAPPQSTELFVLRIKHEWGTMHDAALKIPKGTPDNSKIWKYLNKLERGLKNWDDISLTKLRELDHPYYKDDKTIKEPITRKVVKRKMSNDNHDGQKKGKKR